MEYWGVFVCLCGATMFGWYGIQGIRTGSTRIPIAVFGHDEYERGDTMFGFIILMNFVGFVAALCLAYAIWNDWL